MVQTARAEIKALKTKMLYIKEQMDGRTNNQSVHELGDGFGTVQ